MSAFKKQSGCYIYWVDRLNDTVGRGIAWLTLLMVLTTFSIVVLRYLFDIGWIAMQESVAYMHALVFMLGAAYTLKQGGHVRVDVLYQHCSVKIQGWIDFFGTLLLLLPVAIFIVWSSWEYVGNSWAVNEASRNSGGLGGVYLLKTSILLMGGLLILQAIAEALKALLIALGDEQELNHD